MKKRLYILLALSAFCNAAPADIIFTPVTTLVTTSGSVAAGKQHIEFILSSDFAGTINGATVSGGGTLPLSVYSPGEAAPRGTFSAVSYTITAGSAILTTW